jgi:hypothetical protein
MSAEIPSQENFKNEPPLKIRAIPKKIKHSPEVTFETTTELKEQETRLVWEDLGDIVSIPDAFKYATKKLDINSPLDFVKSRIKISTYQKAQGLEQTWVIDKNTYMEIKAWDVMNKLTLDIDKNLISKGVQSEILYVLNNADLSKANSQKLLACLNWFRETHKTDVGFEKNYGPFYANVDSSANTFFKTEQWVAALDNAEVHSNTIVWMVKRGDIEWIVTDPTLLLSGWLLFLFWVFGWKTDYTNNVWKRLGIIITAALLWKPLWNKLGWNELISDLKTAWKTVASEVKAWVENWDMSAHKFTLPDCIKNFWETITWFNDDVSGKISESYNRIMWGLYALNELNKKNNPDLFVNNFSVVAETVNEDTFMNKKIEDLEKVKWDIKGIRELLSKDTVSKLFPGTLKASEKTEREKDLVNYVNLTLSRKSWGEIYVKDLFIEKDIIDSLKTTIAEQNVWYIENKALDNEIKTKIWLIEDKEVKTKIMYLLSNLTIEKDNNRDNYNKLHNFLSENKNISAESKNIIEDIKKIFLSEIVLEDSIKSINDIKLADPKIEFDSLESIKIKVDSLEKIKNNFDKNTDRISGSDNSEFELAYSSKKLELYKKWAELENNPDGDYTKKLNELKKEEEDLKNIQNEKEYKSQLEKISDEIPEVPSIESKPIEFKAYYDKYFVKFEEVRVIAKKSTDSATEKLAKEILWKVSSFKSNYEAVKAKYLKESKTLLAGIKTITIEANNVDNARIEEVRTILDKKLLEYEKLQSEIIEWITFDTVSNDFKGFYAKYVEKKFVIDETKNSFEYIDKKIGTAGDTKEISKNLLDIPNTINDKILELEKNYNLDIDFDKLIEKDFLIELVILINDRKNTIEKFSYKTLSEKFIRLIKEWTKKVQVKYVAEINNSKDIDSLSESYRKYNDEFKSKLSWNFMWMWSLIEEEIVEKAYEEKLQKLLDKQFIDGLSSMTIEMAPKWIEKPFDDLFEKHSNLRIFLEPKITNVKELLKRLDNAKKASEIFLEANPNDKMKKQELKDIVYTINQIIDVLKWNILKVELRWLYKLSSETLSNLF